MATNIILPASGWSSILSSLSQASPCPLFFLALLIYCNSLSPHPLFPLGWCVCLPSLTLSTVFHFSSQILQQLVTVTFHMFLALHLSIPSCHRSEPDFSLLPTQVWPTRLPCPNATSSSTDSAGKIVSQVSVPLFGAGKPLPALWSKTVFLGPIPKWPPVWAAVFHRLTIYQWVDFCTCDKKGRFLLNNGYKQCLPVNNVSACVPLFCFYLT